MPVGLDRLFTLFQSTLSVRRATLGGGEHDGAF